MKGTEKFIQKICKQIEIAVNRAINGFPDAVWLSDVFKQKKLQMSASTIARMYGLTNATSKSYKSTLDNLAKFLEYDNWENYVDDQSTYHFSSNHFLTEEADGFSQSVLEMALHLKRFDTVQIMLEKYNYFESNPVHFATANLIGKYVKKHNYDETLLMVLANTIAGQRLFYECFVDEENDNEYFSKALFTYYLPKVTIEKDVFFVYSFLLAQHSYSGTIQKDFIKEYQTLTKTIDIENLHYHLQSRYFECYMLIDGIEDRLHNNVENYLNRISHFASIREKNEWLLARSIRAILHFGLKKELLNHVQFNEIVNTMMMKKSKSKNSAALYIIQLYWLFSNSDKTVTYQPFHLSIDYLQGNSKERIAIESATASLYSEGNSKKLIEENLIDYCASTKMKWILNLMFH